MQKRMADIREDFQDKRDLLVVTEGELSQLNKGEMEKESFQLLAFEERLMKGRTQLSDLSKEYQVRDHANTIQTPCKTSVILIRGVIIAARCQCRVWALLVLW